LQKVVSFFSSSNIHSLYGYKLIQYNLWLIALKNSSLLAEHAHNQIEESSKS
jgi:hypothetical protein